MVFNIWLISQSKSSYSENLKNRGSRFAILVIRIYFFMEPNY